VVARRGFRRAETRYRTLAIAADWECPAWPADEHTRTLVESYDDGWAWSVPLSATRRQCTVMVEPRSAKAVALQDGKTVALQESYEREIAQAREIASRLTGASQISPSWSCDASVYDAPRPGDRGVLLVGDAASFIEPLSSAGVKKAITSAWRAAVVANTGLTKPAMADTAVDFYVQRERQVFAECQRVARRFFNEAASGHASAFWSARTDTPEPDAADESPGLRLAFDQLRAAAQIRLRTASALRFAEVADIEGREVVLREAIVMPGDDEPVRFAAGVNLPALVRLAPECAEVSELFSAYTTHVGPVPMDGLLTGLSLLIARQALIHEDTRA
jgi:2-polyprenyl-6-methoxyphenol hydroxylase-like FAD-dependent oxidoreductase